MQKRYEILCQISLQHSFFKNKECRGLDLVPTQSCAYWMNKYDLRLVRKSFGYELFYGKTNSQKGPIQLLEEPLQLGFILRPTDPLFINYSHLPLKDFNQHVFYFNNLKTPEENTINSQSDHSIVEMKIRLSKETFVGISDRLLAKSPVFVLKFADDDPQAATPEQINLTLTDELGNHYYVFPTDIADQEIPSFIQLINDQSPHFQIDLRSLPGGSYQLWREDEAVLSFLSQNEGMRAGDLGLMNICLGDLEGKGQPIPSDDEIIQAQYHYHLDFAQRETIWRYYFVNQSDTKYSSLQIINEKNIAFPEAHQSLFVPDEDKVLPNGDIAKVMVSTVKIPLKEMDGPYFKLVIEHSLKRDGRKISTTITLPNANTSRIQAKNIEKNIFYSDIYVYL